MEQAEQNGIIFNTQTLDKPYAGEAFVTPSSEEIESVKHIFEEYGVPYTIGG